MEYSKSLYIEAFNTDRTHPNIWKKLLLWIVFIIIQAALSIFSIDYTKMLTEQGLTEAQAQQSVPFTMVAGVIGTVISSLVVIGITYIITLIIYKIFKKVLSKKAIFGAVLRYYNTILVVMIIILVIQLLFQLDISTVKIDSLNVFARGNTLLSAFSLTNLLTGWLFGVMLHSNGHLSAKWSWIIGIVVFILCVGLTAISA
ncbi:YIP1 family protein [Staphylococcus cornubiensis]|uniref:YIP1 family protein n=1 Tax=Staphylococcus cornubiensis TaxID=1986155 RepID=UPI000A3A7DF6|nr:YIP1 family protein [Staphylococcus cornubiensis]